MVEVEVLVLVLVEEGGLIGEREETMLGMVVGDTGDGFHTLCGGDRLPSLLVGGGDSDVSALFILEGVVLLLSIGSLFLSLFRVVGVVVVVLEEEGSFQ